MSGCILLYKTTTSCTKTLLPLSSYDLVQQLQLGMTYSIAQSGPQGEVSGRPGCLERGESRLVPGSNTCPSLEQGKEYIKGLMEQDGMEIRKQSIPGTGSVPGFLWKEYLPTTFQKLREMFGIDNGDLLLSMTGDETLRVVPSPGKSGSIFVISGDDRCVCGGHGAGSGVGCMSRSHYCARLHAQHCTLCESGCLPHSSAK